MEIRIYLSRPSEERLERTAIGNSEDFEVDCLDGRNPTEIVVEGIEIEQ